MLEKVPWIVLAAFRRIGKLGTMSSECRMRFTVLARVALKVDCSALVPSARKPTPTAAQYLRTSSARIEAVTTVWGSGGNEVL
jgi:hypothetical protein